MCVCIMFTYYDIIVANIHIYRIGYKINKKNTEFSYGQ